MEEKYYLVRYKGKVVWEGYASNEDNAIADAGMEILRAEEQEED